MEFQARAGYRSQITKIVNEATEYLKTCNITVRDTEDWTQLDSIEEELATYLQRLTTARDNLCSIDKDLHERKLEDKNPERIAEYEDNAVGMIARLQVRLLKVQQRLNPCQNEANNSRASASTNPRCSYLPKLKLKTFSGENQEWLPFWENFRANIHQNEGLSGAEKFSYLQSVLTGNAANTISGFTPTDACYDGAISLLQEEYGDKEKLIDKLMQQLMSLPTVHHRTDAPGLRNLYNTVISCSRSLTALGVPSSHYYIMLKTVLLKCMPSELRIDYHRIQKETSVKGENENEATSDSGSTMSFDGDKQVKNIIRFLKQEVESIERATVVKAQKVQAKNTHTHPSTAAGLFTPTVNMQCVFCKSNEHNTKECNQPRTVEEKKQMLKSAGRCFRCTYKGHTAKFCRAKGLFCKICKGKHATVLCEANNKTSSAGTSIDIKSARQHNSNKTGVTNPVVNLCIPQVEKQSPNSVFLQTARVMASSPVKSNQKKLFVRIMIDGGSQRTYVTETIVNKLNLPVVGHINLSVIAFGNKEIPGYKELNTVKICLQSQFDNRSVELVAVVIPNICPDVLPAPEAHKSQCVGVCLADSVVNNRSQEKGLSVLVGADYFWNVVTGKYKRLTARLTAVDTIFGWTIQGPSETGDDEHFCDKVSTLCSFSVESLWNLETLGIRSNVAEMNTYTQELQKKCIRKTATRYEAKLPWKSLGVQLEPNKHQAVSRLYALTKRLSREPMKLKEYDTAMREFIQAGFAESVSTHETTSTTKYYMPHHPVYRPEKATTKIRIVFDASSRSQGNLSLNDCLWTGSNLLPDILLVILGFRVGEIGLIADIEKAFLQISLAEEDRDSHRFLWFSEPPLSAKSFPSLCEYRMTRVTFGVTCSPFLLSAILELHIQLSADEFPETCLRLKGAFYVDDLATSVQTSKEATLFFQESVDVLKRANMNLRKWATNDMSVQKDLGIESGECVQMVLGLRWNTLSDELMINYNFDDIQNFECATKRNLLKMIARVYDPLGYLSPIIIRLKILFQSLWSNNLSWDEPLNPELHKEWNVCLKNFDQIANLPLSRWLGINMDTKVKEMHIFADASLKAFGAVAFLRVEDLKSGVQVKFVCAKARVAPLKKANADDLSLPKLELTAALIAARLHAYFKKSGLPVDKYYLWTDSQIALHWIKGDARKWKPYVFNRVREIQELTNVNDWRHCIGSENPADLITRGISVDKFATSTLWKDGPPWLKRRNHEWLIGSHDSEKVITLTAYEETKVSEVPEAVDPILPYDAFSNWLKLLRITAYVFRVVNAFLGRERPQGKFLTAKDIQHAKIYWLKYFQNISFFNEILSLQQGKPVCRSSSLLTLNPFLDELGLIRVGSRLQQLDESLDVINPIILPKSSVLSKLIISYFHEKTLHAGVNAVLVHLREEFWLPSGRQVIKRIIASCRVCKKLRGKPASQPFAPLPRERIRASKPFETVGVDFAGPLYTSGSEKCKVYVMIFTCAVVRAIHLELVPNLTTESCLLAIRRFISRRGSPQLIYSDNAKTFKKAAMEVRAIGDILDSEIFTGFLSNRGISWRFSIDRAPWWGGFWERMVKSVKNVLKVTIWKARIDNEELHTLLTEAENVINMRPLTYISDDPMDLSPLTPQSFLIGCTKVTENEIDSQHRGISASEMRVKWRSRIQNTSFLWKRWKTEYLHLLRSAHHTKHTFSKDIQLGDVVLVYDAATPRIHWRLAVVESCFPGRDGKIRGCEVRFADGKRLRRAIQMLYPLELRQLPRAEDVKN